MSTWLSWLNSLAGGWAEAMWRASWQGGLALGLVWAVCRLTPRLPPNLHCWLWRVAYLKVLVALFWATPIDLPILPPHPSLGSGGLGFVDRTEGGILARNGSRPSYLPAPPSAYTALTPAAPAVRGRGNTAMRLSWALGLLLAWLSGAGWHFGRLFWQWRRMARLRRGCETCLDAPVLRLLTELCRRLQLRFLPELLISQIPGPLVVGALRPAIVLPADLQVTEAEREWILAHELAHVKRCDLWWAHLPVLTRVLFFFHPVIWLGHREWRLAQEMACDALTVRITSARACDYGELLVRLASQRPEMPEAGLTAVGILESGTTLDRRLNVLRSTSTPTRTQGWCGSILVALTLSGLIPWRVSAQASAAPTPPLRSSSRKPLPVSPAATPAPARPLSTTPGVDPRLHAAPAASRGKSVMATRPRVAAATPPQPARAVKRSTQPKPTARAASRPSKKAITAPPVAEAVPAGPAITDPGILQAAGISVGPYGGLIATLTPAELLQYVATERTTTLELLESMRARVRHGAATAADLAPLETKSALLDILMRAAERLAQAPAVPKRPELSAVLTPTELLQFLRVELQGARLLRAQKQAQYDRGIAPGTELLPLVARTQQLEILMRAAERRVEAPR